MSKPMLCADPRRSGAVSGFWSGSYLRLDRASEAGLIAPSVPDETAMRSRRILTAELAAALATRTSAIATTTTATATTRAITTSTRRTTTTEPPS